MNDPRITAVRELVQRQIQALRFRTERVPKPEWAAAFRAFDWDTLDPQERIAQAICSSTFSHYRPKYDGYDFGAFLVEEFAMQERFCGLIRNNGGEAISLPEFDPQQWIA